MSRARHRGVLGDEQQLQTVGSDFAQIFSKTLTYWEKRTREILSDTVSYTVS